MKLREKVYRLADGDLQKARAISMLSAGQNLYPGPYKWVVQAPDRGDPVVRWHLTANRVGDKKYWVPYKGNPDSGILPRDYKTAAILTLGKEEFDAQIEEYGGKPAVAYLIGRCIMAAEMPDGFGIDSRPNFSNEMRYAVAPRVGRGLLEVTAGRYDPESNMFFSAGKALRIPNIDVGIPDIPPQIPIVQ